MVRFQCPTFDCLVRLFVVVRASPCVITCMIISFHNIITRFFLSVARHDFCFLVLFLVSSGSLPGSSTISYSIMHTTIIIIVFIIMTTTILPFPSSILPSSSSSSFFTAVILPHHSSSSPPSFRPKSPLHITIPHPHPLFLHVLRGRCNAN